VRLYDLQARAGGPYSTGTGTDTNAAAAANTLPTDWITHFTGHSAPVFGLDFSPDNQLLFSASGDGTVRWAGLGWAGSGVSALVACAETA